ncbi:SAP domain-containing protein [Alloiococcus sp. CFN-8]|uniref:SAP domain-containing protein n=1 Tax=Alloiococcus sp. CFN-8 TaxID=3416081 RepID=UPI003CE73B7A
MGLFDLFKKKDKPVPTPLEKSVNTKVPKEEKKYYQPDSYYTDVIAEGTDFERKVISFEDRKKTAIPSNRGLYPAEILLLEYCSKGTYPEPKNGYPGFWWFAYGIRDVGVALKSLEDRGYIAFASAKDSVKGFTVPQLKELLVEKGLSTTGKKAELVARVAETVPEEELLAAGVQVKYLLTEIGQQELCENAYVPYMHSAPNKTTEDERWGMTFNVWSINKLLGRGDKSNWKAVVDEQERKMNKETSDRNDVFMKDLKKIDPEGYNALKTQDQQIADVQKARDKYSKDKDLDSYIAFWEMIWANGGLRFEGTRWHFELPDLYIKAKRYDDALAFVTKLKRTKPTYAYKSDTYIKKIEEIKAKRVAKNKK